MIKLNTKSLLYLEDEIEMLNNYSNFFDNYFKEVFVASDGKEALEIFNDEKIDIAILDINVPFINGLEVAKKIRTYSSTIPIILLTARDDKETYKKAINIQVTMFLEKPIKRNDLNQLLYHMNEKFMSNNVIQLWHIDNTLYEWSEESSSLLVNKNKLHLTKKEVIVLDVLINSYPKKISYQDMYEFLSYDSEQEYNEGRIKTLLSGLRKKLPKGKIINHYGIGYALDLKK